MLNKNLRISLLLSAFFLSFVVGVYYGNGWLFVLGFIFLGILIYTNIKYSSQVQGNTLSNFNEILLQNDFTPDSFHVGDNQLSGIAISESQSKIAFLNRSDFNSPFTFKSFDFKDIVESSIVEDGETITKSSRGSSIGGAIVGGVVAGSTGAIIGGLSGSKTSSESIRKITLSVVVDSLSHPIYEVNYLNLQNPISKNNQIYKETYSSANKWHKTISVILKRNELNTQSM